MIKVPGYEMGGILYTEEDIREKIKELGRQISKDYKGKQLTVIGILKGSIVFMADLIREIDADVVVDFMQVSSYGNSTKSSGNVRIKKDLESSPVGKHLLIVEDIIDTGNTLKYLRDTYLAGKNPKSVKIVTMLDKPSRRKADIQADYTGFTIDDLFVIGYGLDYAQQFRHLPYIAYLREVKEEAEVTEEAVAEVVEKAEAAADSAE